jgi:hypothetical protein
MDLCRRILQELETRSTGVTGSDAREVYLDGHDLADVRYHVRLLSDARLVETVNSMAPGEGEVCVPRRLTWAGHEFLKASRKETLWQKAKSTVLEKTGGLSFDVLKAFLTKLANDAVFGG